jgi:Acyl-CoA carboxylase epsilon subunit
MELTVVRGQATPEELEAIVAALVQRLAEVESELDAVAWSDPVRQVRRPFGRTGSEGWRLGGWAA